MRRSGRVGYSVIMESLEGVRAKLSALAGAPLEDADVAQLLAEIVGGGGGVHIEVDDANRYKLVRRDGRFVLTKDSSRTRASSVPPKR